MTNSLEKKVSQKAFCSCIRESKIPLLKQLLNFKKDGIANENED